MVKVLLKYIKQHPALWTAGLFLPAFADLTSNLALAYGIEAFTEELTLPYPGITPVIRIMALTAAIILIATLIEDAARYIFAVFIVKAENSVRQDQFIALVRAQYAELGRINRGELVTRYCLDTESTIKLLSWDVFAVLYPIVLGTGYLVAVFFINVLLGVMMLCFVLAVIGLNVLFTKRFTALEKAGLEVDDGVAQILESTIRGKMSLRLLSAGPVMEKRIGERVEEAYGVEARKVSWTALRLLTVETITAACNTLAAPAACLLAAMGHIPLSAAAFILQISRYLIGSTQDFGVAFTSFRNHSVSYKRVRRITDLPQEENSGNKAMPELAAGTLLECEGAHIAYNGKTAVRDVCLQVRPGEITGLIGRSGSGKSSIVKAVLRLIDYEGRIQFKGVPIKNLPLEEYRRRIAYVPETSDLFSGTVRENLFFAAPEAGEEELEKVMKSVSLGKELLEKQAGLGGSALSGGQRQRVAIARALLVQAKLLILDEPTAALDVQSEEALLETLARLKAEGMGILIISHRKSTVGLCDHICEIG